MEQPPGTIQAELPLEDIAISDRLTANEDGHLKLLSGQLGVDISVSDGMLLLEGAPAQVGNALEVLNRFVTLMSQNKKTVSPEEVMGLIQAMKLDHDIDTAAMTSEVVFTTYRGKRISPKSPGQALLVQGLQTHDVMFCSGPAGTGKSYLAVAHAVALLRRKEVSRLVLVRPAVEAGERLGFLPGDIEAKINPYLRPLLDALRDIIDFEQFKRFSEQDVIEVIPLAYMRGRTLNDAFIILDEAQNASIAQMKMFLTRMGIGSKIVVAGDITQIDLPTHQKSGLVDAMHRLRNIKGFKSVRLTESDIVRHRLVQEIVQAYDDPSTGTRKE